MYDWPSAGNISTNRITSKVTAPHLYASLCIAQHLDITSPYKNEFITHHASLDARANQPYSAISKDNGNFIILVSYNEGYAPFIKCLLSNVFSHCFTKFTIVFTHSNFHKISLFSLESFAIY